MISLFVFDFDKTLIPFDSFRRYVFHWLKYKPLAIIKFLVFRKLRIYDGAKFKRKIIRSIFKHPKFESINQKFVESLIPHVNFKIISNQIENESKTKIILILSASPDIYISEVANAIELVGKGSHFVNNQFFHLYGTGKIEYLKRYYPKERYRYVYSISDSKSDLDLLKLFESYTLI